MYKICTLPIYKPVKICNSVIAPLKYTRCPEIVGHLCCVYKFGVEVDDTEESVAVADSVEASASSS